MIFSLGGCERTSAVPSHPEKQVILPFPRSGAYTGAYIEFGKTEDYLSLDAIEDFETLIGKRLTIVAFSSFWGEETFPGKNVHIVTRHGALPLIFWSPWDKPYVEERGPDRFSLDAIVTGRWDAYITTWLDSAGATGHPILVSWGLEMNGDWFPWSGIYYQDKTYVGVEAESRPTYAGPELFKKAFRHVVDLARSRHVHNVLWGFHCNNFSYPPAEWNTFAAYYPGSDYVDWLGLSVYGKQFPTDAWLSFHESMDRAYREICALDPQKPVIVAEWGVGEFPREGDKASWIRDALEAFRLEYPRVKGAVYWHERWKNSDETYSNLRVNSSPAALAAYRHGVRHPHWLDRLETTGSAGATR